MSTAHIIVKRTASALSLNPGLQWANLIRWNHAFCSERKALLDKTVEKAKRDGWTVELLPEGDAPCDRRRNSLVWLNEVLPTFRVVTPQSAWSAHQSTINSTPLACDTSRAGR